MSRIQSSGMSWFSYLNDSVAGFYLFSLTWSTKVNDSIGRGCMYYIYMKHTPKTDHLCISPVDLKMVATERRLKSVYISVLYRTTTAAT